MTRPGSTARRPPAEPSAAAAQTARVAAGVSIRASRERVWAQLTDFASMHRWFVGVRAVELDGPPGVGARRRVTFRGGLTHLETVHSWTPPVRLALASAGHSRLITSGDVDIGLAEGRQGVRLDWSIAYRLNLPPLAAALIRPLVRAGVGAALRWSLARLKRLVEAPTGDCSS